MKKWEYKTVTMPSTDIKAIQTVLTDMGNKSWQLVTVHDITIAYAGVQTMYIFKRESVSTDTANILLD